MCEIRRQTSNECVKERERERERETSKTWTCTRIREKGRGVFGACQTTACNANA